MRYNNHLITEFISILFILFIDGTIVANAQTPKGIGNKVPCSSESSDAIITFYANITQVTDSGLPGHAWIGLCVGDEEKVVGFYLNGVLNDSKRKSDISYSYRVPKNSIKRALTVIDRYRSKKYLLGVCDCRYFVGDIAKELGFRIPPIGTKSPAEWIADLVDAN